jgi:hypothetical protein
MSETLKPALTPEQWARARRFWPSWLDDKEFIRAYFGEDAAYRAAALAIANHQLPPDSPYKITRADVEDLTFCLDAPPTIRHYPANTVQNAPDTARVARARRAIAKLAALLPPEAS